MSDSPKITTIESALSWARTILKPISESYAKEARLLLADVMQTTHEFLMRYPERTLTFQQADEFNRLVTERSKGTPIAYLLGRRGFFDIEVTVTPDVLIPRPETELLVEKAIEWARHRGHCFIVDVGAGSGVIALVLAKHLPNAHVTGIDVSENALQVAQQNSLQLGLDKRVRWVQGDMLRPLVERREKADLIVANLPYIPTADLATLEVARHEPHLALDGGVDGLDPIRRLLADVPAVLKPDGLVLMEIGADQGQAVRNLVQQSHPQLQVITVETDLAGLDRIVSVCYE